MLSMEDKIWIQRQINRAVAEITGRPERDPLDSPEDFTGVGISLPNLQAQKVSQQ